MRSKEIVICGSKAVRSRFETNSDSVLRLFFNRATAPSIGDLCRWMAQERLVYRCVETEELESISGTVHHGGVVVVVELTEPRSPYLDEVFEWARNRESILLLDRISNVHNLGAIIRSAAFFGVKKLVLPDHPKAAMPSEATYRVAEGGLEHVEVFRVDDLAGFIHAIRRVYRVIGAASRGGDPAGSFQSDRPTALVMGNEEQGLDERIASACDALVTIPGSHQVESLNVSAAAAVLLFEMTRQQWKTSASRNTQKRNYSQEVPRPNRP